MTHGAWVLAAPPDAVRELRPLVRAHERAREVRVVDGTPDVEACAGAAGVLVVHDRRRSPRTVLPGAFVTAPDGSAVPIGCLPRAADLETFARAAASVERRAPGTPGPLVVLAQWERRYLRLARRMEARVRGREPLTVPVLQWTADRVTRHDLVRGLAAGLGVAVYFGHGRPTGWAAYHGLRARHLLETRRAPLGALHPVTCLTANRWRTGLSFSEAVVIGGVAAAAVGAVARVKHVDNMRWMLGFADTMRAGELRLGPALLRAAPPSERARAAYRIVGDPLAPLLATPTGAARAAKLWAPPPSDPLERVAA